MLFDVAHWDVTLKYVWYVGRIQIALLDLCNEPIN